MTNYRITYDNHNHRDYRRLYQLLASWRAVRLSESDWLVRLNGPAEVVRNFVAAQLEPDDTIAVVEIPKGADWATQLVTPAASAWLSANVLPAKKAA